MKFAMSTLELPVILNAVSNLTKTKTANTKITNLIPNTNFIEVQLLLNQVHEFLTIITKIGPVPLFEDFDVFDLLEKAKRDHQFSINDVLILVLFLKMEKEILNYFQELKDSKLPTTYLAPTFFQVVSHLDLHKKINLLIDDHGIVASSATKELPQIRSELKKTENNLKNTLDKLVSKYSSYLNDHMLVLRNNRLTLPVKESYKNNVKGIIHDISASQQTVYIEPAETNELTNQIESLKVKEINEINKVLHQITNYCAKNYETLFNNINIFIELDILTAKAQYALSTDSYRPILNDQEKINLINAKHPLIDPKKVVPIDISLDNQFPTLLITGPNTGGKTAALKTVGLLTLMTQVGLLIPAKETSEISIFNSIYADIGDEQSIAQSLSTFSSHLTKIIEIVNNADNKSLVLLDELGSGTDPVEGVSLAIGIIDFLRTKKVKLIVTTHYSELKSYAYENNDIMSASVMFDEFTLEPLYKVLMGTTGSSHALLIASRLGLPQEIITNATNLVQKKQTDLSKAIEKLSFEKNQLTKERREYEELLKNTKHQQEKYLQLENELITKSNQILKEVATKEEKKWQQLNQQARTLIGELEDKHTLDLKEAAYYKHQTNQNVETKIIKKAHPLEKGDTVYILTYQQLGQLIDINQNRFLVRFGDFELEFTNDQLEYVAPEQHSLKKTKRPISRPSLVKENVTTELDLRGFRYEDVKLAIDQAIDDLILSNLNTLRIIHGFGMGVIRTAVQDYIKTSKQIKSSRFGGEGEGLNGVTIITLK